MRIYTLLKQYEKLKKREIEVDVLRDMLGIGKEQYQQYNDLRRYIILATQKELAAKADIYFEFEEIKYGRRVGAILFHIFSKKLPAELLANDESPVIDINNNPPAFIRVNLPANPVIDDLLLLVAEPYRNRKGVLACIIEFEKKQGFEYVRRNILYCNASVKSNYGKLFSDSLKNDWGHDWHAQQQQPKPRVLEVWEKQGFKSQKEYDTFKFEETMAKYKKKQSN
jgi:hypothetical protein